jgi:hypothetical protein
VERKERNRDISRKKREKVSKKLGRRRREREGKNMEKNFFTSLALCSAEARLFTTTKQRNIRKCK